VLSSALAIHGLRKQSLSPSGACAAFIVGVLTMSAKLNTFGVSLIAFYLLGSRATKFGRQRKQQLEQGNHASGAGYRNASQVLCNALTATLGAAAWQALFVPHSTVATILRSLVDPRISFEKEAWCAISFSSQSSTPPASSALVLLSLAHFGCCLGDTLASELGILSSAPPRLITTLKKVPPGTNGGISLVGTLASLSGGCIMGLITVLSLLVENPACRTDKAQLVFSLLGYGALSGLAGSMIDSLLGATLQETRLSLSSQRILQDDVVPEGRTRIISGVPVLNNNQVNLVSAVATGCLVVWIWSSTL